MRFSTVFPQLFHMVFHRPKIELPWRAIVCCANRTSSACPCEIAVGAAIGRQQYAGILRMNEL